MLKIAIPRSRITDMVMRSTLLCAAAMLAASAGAYDQKPQSTQAAAKLREASAARPNIVVFLADDLGYLDTAPYGDPDARTPNLARLAASGLAFDQAFVASPACAPSRAALLTGLMPARNGAEANQKAPDADIRKLPAYLQSLGYEVVAFGKVSHYRQTGLYGFDHFEHDTYHDPEGIPSAVRWLKARTSKRPLAIFVGSNWPHVPWPRSNEGYRPEALSLPEKTIGTPMTREMRARYYAGVSRMDQELGDVLNTVDATLGRNTFVLFSSDHGAQWPFGKWNLYDTGTRVPMVVRWQGKVAAGTRTNAMVSWVDILPTLVDVAGGKPPHGLDGQSFARALKPGSTWRGRETIYATHNNDGNVNVYPMRSVRTPKWKYISNLHPEYVYTTHIDQYVRNIDDSGRYFPSWRRSTDPAAQQIVNSYYRRPAEELYDLEADPAERNNLAADSRYKTVLQSLRRKLKVWRTKQGDTRPVEGTPHFQEGPIDGKVD
jgi:arylsulfatase A-like enzyme